MAIGRALHVMEGSKRHEQIAGEAAYPVMGSYWLGRHVSIRFLFIHIYEQIIKFLYPGKFNMRGNARANPFFLLEPVYFFPREMEFRLKNGSFIFYLIEFPFESGK